MVFIGYEKDTKAYTRYDPPTMEVHISRDVIFEEGRKRECKDNDDAVEEGQVRFSTLPDLVVDDLTRSRPYQENPQ